MDLFIQAILRPKTQGILSGVLPVCLPCARAVGLQLQQKTGHHGAYSLVGRLDKEKQVEDTALASTSLPHLPSAGQPSRGSRAPGEVTLDPGATLNPGESLVI